MKNLSFRQIILLMLFAAVIVAGLGYWAFTSFRWEEKEINHGYSTEAKQNDFLAAEIFLRRHGIPATSIKNLSLLEKHRWRDIALGADDTIVLVNANKTLNQERYDRLYEWIENGGTLITSTQNPYIGAHTTQEDLLLRDFGVKPAVDGRKDIAEKLFDLFDNKDEANNEQDKDSNEQKDKEKTDSNKPEQDKAEKKKTSKSKTKEKPENHYRCNLDKEPTHIEFADEAKPLAFDFSRHNPFTYENGDETTDSADAENSSHMLYFEVGAGGITITSDTSIWTNQRIDCHEHAYALWRLVNHNGRVWFLTNQDAPSLTSIIWRNAPYGVLAALIALGLWLWAKSQRFGPTFVGSEQARRSLAEHIYASAMLLWRNQQHPELLKLLRQQVIHRLQLHPQVFSAGRQQQIIFLHELTGISSEALERALFADNLYHPQDFANAVAHLQTIRKQL